MPLRKLTHLLILDFEASCGDAIRTSLKNQEIIEFPTILYNLSTRQVEGTFHEYVRPVKVPQLTDFCTELTGITQVRVLFRKDL
jgi:ERI1 exoribonuclease 3